MMEELIQKVKVIALTAGEKIMEIYADVSSFGVEMKSDDSPLTRADKAANEVIVEGLEQLDVSYPIISEENKLQDYEDRKLFERFWLVDPLDGTKEFIKRNGEFTVNIALVKNGEVIMGVVVVPVSKEVYWAAKGLGAFYESADEIRPLTATSFSKNDKGLRVVCSRSHINEGTQAFINELHNPITVSKGSSLKFLVMAAGEAELYPRLGPTMEWDTAAAQIILEEAGGRVYQFDNGEKLQYNKENLLNPYFVATGNMKEL